MDRFSESLHIACLQPDLKGLVPEICRHKFGAIISLLNPESQQNHLGIRVFFCF